MEARPLGKLNSSGAQAVVECDLMEQREKRVAHVTSSLGFNLVAAISLSEVTHSMCSIQLMG